MISVELERPYGVCPHCGDDTSWNNDYQYGWTVQSTAHEQFELVWDDPDCNKLRTQLGANCHWRCRTCGHNAHSTEIFDDMDKVFVSHSIHCNHCNNHWKKEQFPVNSN
jgi:hypothetical protein